MGNNALSMGYLFDVKEYETTVTTISGYSKTEYDLYYGSAGGDVGVFCLPVSLHDFVGSLSSEDVLVEVDLDKHTAKVSGGGAVFSAESIDVGEYRADYDLGDVVAKVRFNGDYLSKAVRLLNTIKPNMSMMAGSDSLTGFIFQKGYFVTTDTYRVGALKFSGDNLPDVSIDRQFMVDVSKLIKGIGSVTMVIGSEGVKVYNDFMRMYGKVIDGKPAPDLLGFFDRQHSTVCKVAGFLLSGAMEQAKSSDSRSVKIRVDANNELSVFAGSSFKSIFPALVEGDSIEVYVNPVFFDIIKEAVDNVQISFKGEKDPIIMEWDGFRYFIFPVVRSG